MIALFLRSQAGPLIMCILFVFYSVCLLWYFSPPVVRTRRRERMRMTKKMLSLCSRARRTCASARSREPEPYMFGRIGGIVRDVRARIIVADGQANEIRVFSPQGEFLFAFGRVAKAPANSTAPVVLLSGRMICCGYATAAMPAIRRFV